MQDANPQYRIGRPPRKHTADRHPYWTHGPWWTRATAESEDAGIEVGGRYSIRELERRIDSNDGKAYDWEVFCEYYTRRRGWFVYQARAFWDSLEIARPHFQVRPLAKGGSASGIESWPNCNSTASPFWDTTKRVYQQKTVRKHG